MNQRKTDLRGPWGEISVHDIGDRDTGKVNVPKEDKGERELRAP